ncbi:Rossmann-like and DUF2520 domain-containing protein [Sphingobium sp.]|uniref:Rossmann-like and DUF2520 domain-containing protein n=1 Tax=Sphingobium sp. TaxID=1912891 RepID=UPI003B3A7682
MQAHPLYSRIAIIGTGRVAHAMALAMHGHSAAPLLIWGRDNGKSHALASAIPGAIAAPDLATIASTCGLILIAVSDDAIPHIVDRIANAMPEASAAFVTHMSGRSGAASLSPLASRGALTAAVHPAMTFTGDPSLEVARMKGARFVITAGTPPAILAARQLVDRLGGVAEQVGEDQRALYHAALCHAANHLVTLIAGSRDALAMAGIADPSALLAPLVRAALDNGLDRGIGGLSGPLLRGDVDSIARHLTALSADQPRLLPAYRAMAIATLDALEDHGAAAMPPLRTLLD